MAAMGFQALPDDPGVATKQLCNCVIPRGRRQNVTPVTDQCAAKLYKTLSIAGSSGVGLGCLGTHFSSSKGTDLAMRFLSESPLSGRQEIKVEGAHALAVRIPLDGIGGGPILGMREVGPCLNGDEDTFLARSQCIGPLS
jgi:hypothetical protein